MMNLCSAREQWEQQIVQEGDQILLFQVIAGG